MAVLSTGVIALARTERESSEVQRVTGALHQANSRPGALHTNTSFDGTAGA
jgi:hypothetical protein